MVLEMVAVVTGRDFQAKDWPEPGGNFRVSSLISTIIPPEISAAMNIQQAGQSKWANFNCQK